MKMDALTLGSVGFAAFAAWAYLKPKTGNASVAAATGNNNANALNFLDIWNMSTSQKDASKGAQWQNTDYLSSWAQPNMITGANLLTGGTPYVGIWQP